jgi:putative membrane protein
VNSGLLKRNEFTVPINKIQFVEWYSNFLRKIPGFESVKIFQGQSGDTKKQSVEVPACFDEQTAKLMSTLFPESQEGREFDTYHVDSFYERFLLVVWGFIGTAGAVVLALTVNMTSGLIALAVFLVVLFIWTKKYVNSISLQSNGRMLIYQHGWLFRRRMALKNYKIQSVSWTQSFFQKRRNTAHLTLYTAAGSRTIRFINADLAKAMHNYLLYTVETSKKGWM